MRVASENLKQRKRNSKEISNPQCRYEFEENNFKKRHILKTLKVKGVLQAKKAPLDIARGLHPLRRPG